MGKKKELEQRLEREHNAYSALFKEKQELQEKLYRPMKKDELMKELAVEFGQFLITMNVRYANYEKKLYKTQTGMAPDMLVESMERIWDRFISNKSNDYK